VHGDAGDPFFSAGVTAGASVLYHCMNPAYDAAVWARELPRLGRALIDAAARAQARLVVIDNLYMLGDPHGLPMNEDTPMRPCSPKGEVRAQVATMYADAHRKGDARIVSGRAADYYGPGGVQTYFGAALMPRILAGKSAQVLTDPDVTHTYHYTLDVAAGLATLGEAPDDAYGGWWMLPAAPAGTTTDMIRRIGKVLGREPKIERVPGFVQSVMSLFMPIMRELREMHYEFATPFVTDDARFRARFGAVPTPLDDGVRAMVEWAREVYAPS
jgi:nucleoside-diphosphate-sugar epimerase